MIDMHSHCLAGIDDGAKSLEESLKMLTEAKKNKTEFLVATPHIRPYEEEDIDKAIEKRDKAFSQVINAAKEETIPVLLKGFEVRLDVEITQIKNFKKMCIQNTDYMLVEMPFKIWDDFAIERLELLAKSGVTPVMAHIERYLPFKGNIKKALALDNVIYQVNADSFLNFKTCRFIKKLIKSGKIVVAGSDMHGAEKRKSRLHEAYGKIEKKGDVFRAVFFENGEKILNGNRLMFS